VIVVRFVINGFLTEIGCESIQIDSGSLLVNEMNSVAQVNMEKVEDPDDLILPHPTPTLVHQVIFHQSSLQSDILVRNVKANVITAK
jgi:hypothetical protein